LTESGLKYNNKKIPHYHEQQFDTFSPSKQVGEIDYSKGVSEYMNEMSKTI
jgi:hypothetical protein